MAEREQQQTNSSSMTPVDTPGNSIGLEEIIRKALMGKYDDQNSDEPPSVEPQKTQRRLKAPRAPSKKRISRPRYGPPSVVPPLSGPISIVPLSVSVRSDSPDSHLQKSQSEPLRETDSTASTVSIHEPPRFHLQREQSEPLRETDSTASTVSVKSESSMFEPPFFHLQRGQSEPLRETDSTVSSVSMKSDSSMIDPLNFNLKRKQSQLTEEIYSCSVCLEAVKDPVPLLCGHWSCKQCVLSHWDQNRSTADDPCKKCGRRFKGEPEHQTDSEEDKKNLNLPSASRPAPQNTTGPAGREKTDLDLQSVLLEKTIKRVEMETEKLQAEKEKLLEEKGKLRADHRKSRAEREKFELEKRKLALEIQLLEQKSKYTNYDQGVLMPKYSYPIP